MHDIVDCVVFKYFVLCVGVQHECVCVSITVCVRAYVFRARVHVSRAYMCVCVHTISLSYCDFVCVICEHSMYVCVKVNVILCT